MSALARIRASRQPGRLLTRLAPHSLRSQASQTVGRLVATPGDIQEAIKETDAYLRAIGNDVQLNLVAAWHAAELAGTLPVALDRDHNDEHAFQPEFVHAWRLFMTEWDNFYREHVAHWYENLWGGYWDRNLDYRRRGREFQAKYEALTGKSAGMEPLADPHGAKPGLGLPDIPWKPIITVGALVLALIVAPPIVQSLTARRASGGGAA